MTEQDLIDLGFKKEIVTKEQSGGPIDWHYYTYEFAKGFSLISQASDEVTDDNWAVEVFETEGKIQYNDKSIVKLLIEIINKGK
jgi:hypothetical protein